MISPAVNKAYKMLEEEEEMEYCQGVAEEGKALTDDKVKNSVSSMQSLSLYTQLIKDRLLILPQLQTSRPDLCNEIEGGGGCKQG